MLLSRRERIKESAKSKAKKKDLNAAQRKQALLDRSFIFEGVFGESRKLLETLETTENPAASNVSNNTPYPTIQDAVDAAANGEAVAVFPGTHEEMVTISGLTNFTLFSLSWQTNGGDRSGTVIDGSGQSWSVQVDACQNVSVIGFSIIKKGINIISPSASVQVVSNTIYNGWTDGITADGNSHTFAHNTIYNDFEERPS